MKEKKLLVVCQHFWPEEFRINDICDFLVKRGCDIDVLCGIPNYPSGRFAQGYSFFKNRKQVHNGVNIRRVLEIPRGNNSNFRIFINYISFPLASIFHIPRLLNKKYDKILLYSLSPVMMSFAGIVVGRIKKIETTMYVLDLWPENLFSVLRVKNKWLRGLANRVSHWHYRHVDKLIVLSEMMKERLIEKARVPAEKIIVLPQACEKIYEEEIHDKELAERFKDGFNILFAGNISPAQSFETVIAAAKNLEAEGLTDIRWIILGDGMSRKWLEDEVTKSNLQKRFVFEGRKPVEEIPKYTGIADALLGCLVKSELLEATVPAKVMSYFAAGKPIVLAMDGEVRELINDKARCGFAGPAGDSDTLTDNVRKLHALSPVKRHELGERARSYHFKHFERNLILSKLYDFIFR